jgi:hypothetical protein
VPQGSLGKRAGERGDLCPRKTADQNAGYEEPVVVQMQLETIGREYDLVAFNAIRVKYFFLKFRIAGCDMFPLR